jgi:hypothetical protein
MTNIETQAAKLKNTALARVARTVSEMREIDSGISGPMLDELAELLDACGSAPTGVSAADVAAREDLDHQLAKWRRRWTLGPQLDHIETIEHEMARMVIELRQGRRDLGTLAPDPGGDAA